MLDIVLVTFYGKSYEFFRIGIDGCKWGIIFFQVFGVYTLDRNCRAFNKTTETFEHNQNRKAFFFWSL